MIDLLQANWKVWGLCLLAGIGILDSLVVGVFSNFNLGTVLPGLIGLGLLVFVWVIKREKAAVGHQSYRLIRICLVSFACLWGLSFILIEGIIVLNSSAAKDPEAAYLIVPGAAIHGDTVSLALQSRLDKAREYMIRYPHSKAILSGGQGSEENLPEAIAMQRYLVDRGIPGDRLLAENQATSTIENFTYTKKLLQKNGIWRHGMKIAVVTNDFHMARACWLAKICGFVPLSYPAATPLQVIGNCYLREYFAYSKAIALYWRPTF